MATTQPDASKRIPDMASFVTRLHQAFSGPASLKTDPALQNASPNPAPVEISPPPQPTSRTPWLGLALGGVGLTVLVCMGMSVVGGGSVLWLRPQDNPPPSGQPVPQPGRPIPPPLSRICIWEYLCIYSITRYLTDLVI